MKYIPSQGDIVWLQFNPQTGHEHSGKRPALTISPKKYNAKVGLAIFLPITSVKKGYPFEVAIKGKKISGVILSDQVKNLDWQQRQAQFIEKASKKSIVQAIEYLNLLIKP